MWEGGFKKSKKKLEKRMKDSDVAVWVSLTQREDRKMLKEVSQNPKNITDSRLSLLLE